MLPTKFQFIWQRGEDFLEINQSETKNCLWQPCLLTDRDKISKLYRVSSIYVMYPTKFQFIWRSSFRKEDFQKSTNQKQELPVAAMFKNGSELNEQTL